jgi:hypothetical protein
MKLTTTTKILLGVFLVLFIGIGLTYAQFVQQGCIEFIGGDLRPKCDLANLKWDETNNQLVLGGTNITATAAEINAAADVSSRLVSLSDATSYTVLAANSGKVHMIPDLTANMTLTLPTATAGLEYTFVGKGVAADAQNWIFAAGVPYKGGLAFADTDAGAGADEIHAGVFPNGSSNDNMTIVTPGAGTIVRLYCDGTNWFVNGQVFSATVPSFAD